MTSPPLSLAITTSGCATGATTHRPTVCRDPPPSAVARPARNGHDLDPAQAMAIRVAEAVERGRVGRLVVIGRPSRTSG